MTFKTIIFTSVIALGACSPKTKTAGDDKKSAKFPNAEVEEGFALNGQYCGRCHEFKVIKNYSREQWDKILPNMAKRAKLTEEQQEKVNQYINWELAKK